MLTSYEAWAGIALPAAVTALALIAGWRVGRRRLSASASRSYAGPLAVGLGFVAGYAALFEWPALPPHESLEWLPWCALPLAACGMFEAASPSLGARVLAASAWSPLIVTLIGWPLVGGAGLSAWAAAGITLALFSLVIASEELANRVSAARLGAMYLAVALLASATLTISGSLRLGQIALVLAATQAGALIARPLLGRAGEGRGVSLVFYVLLTGLLGYGWLFSELSAASAALLLTAPQVGWLAIDSPRHFSSRRRAVMQVAVVALVAGLSLALAWWHAPSPRP